MSLQHVPTLAFPRPFKTLADAEAYAKQLRAGIMEWAATMPEHVTIATMGLTSLSDPNDDRIVFWDDSAGNLAFLDIGTSLSISTTTLDAIQDIRTTAGPSWDHVHLTVATGTAPLVVASTTMASNLNADLLDGYHASSFLGLPALTDPDDDRIIFWDDSEGALKWLDLGNSLATTAAVLDTIQDIRTTAGPTFDHIHLPAMTEGSVSGIFHGTENLIRSFMPTGADGYNLFVGDAGNSTMSPGGGSPSLASYNVGIGQNSLVSLTTGKQNFGLGVDTLTSVTTGQRNTAIGTGSMVGEITGSNNTAVGVDSLYSNTAGNLNVALGQGAGFHETGSSKLFIDNAYREDEADGRAKALIYGIFAAATADQYLYVNANLSIPHPITSTLAIGTAPFAVTSTTVNTNLNADLWDGYQFSDYLDQAVLSTSGPTFDHLHVTAEINVGTYGYFGVNDTTRGMVYAYGHGAGSVYGGTFLAYTSADHDTTIQNYGFMVYEDDLYIGPDTNIDALKLDALDDFYITGGSLVLPASEYVNFGGTQGSGGYGLRDNAGDVEYCDSGGSWTALNSLGGGSGAPTDAQYVCLAVNGSLSAERVLTGTANQITITDNGANGTVVLSAPQDLHTGAGPQFDHLYLTNSASLTTTLLVKGASDAGTYQTGKIVDFQRSDGHSMFYIDTQGSPYGTISIGGALQFSLSNPLIILNPDYTQSRLEASGSGDELVQAQGSLTLGTYGGGTGHAYIKTGGSTRADFTDDGYLYVGCNIYPATDNTYYLGKNDDDSPYAWKGVILKDTTNGKYYRIEIINGTITPTDLTD
jgi:hypothetical protein